ncbi:MAG: polynucleotide adenylyltransferase PcnB [Deltaproteobacteria bacterium]|nr:polynucleotide adenylyltransferase PcnB [Deltaproteobacteria bacterium]
MNTNLDYHEIDNDARFILKKLYKLGFIAYIVGGGVRDLLIGRTPKDFDISTNATPRELKRIFRNSRIIGRRFKLVHIYFGKNKIIETSTFRANPNTEEHQADDLMITNDNIFGTPREDALRRDFTVNGLFYDPVERKVIDYIGGIEDIEKKQIRTIGNPDIRFQEDPVRILRALRFAGKLHFNIEDETWYNLVNHREKLLDASHRRVVDEIWKTIFSGEFRTTYPLFIQSGVMELLLPEVNAYMMEEPGYSIMNNTFELFDYSLDNPFMNLSTGIPLLFQGELEELFDKSLIRGNFVTSVYKEKLAPILGKYGFSRKVKDEIHRILQIFVQLGHPDLKRKISPKTKSRDLFSAGVFFWEKIWLTRGYAADELKSISTVVPHSGKKRRRRKHVSTPANGSRSV